MKKIIILSFIFLHINLFGFFTDSMLYKEGGMLSKDKFVNIYLSNRSGLEINNMNEFRNNPNIYFCIQPSDDWRFSDKEPLSIQLINAGEVLDFEANKYSDYDNDESYVVTIPKTEFVITKPFHFENELGRNEDRIFPEEYWDYYEFAFEHFSKGSEFLKQTDYRNAYKELKYFLDNDFSVKFSFYDEAVELLGYSVGEYIRREKEEAQKFMNIKEQIETQRYKFDTTVFAELDSFALKQEEPVKYFDKYFTANLNKSNLFKNEFEKFQENMNLLASESRELYDAALYDSITKKDYKNVKYNAFIDVLARTLCYSDTLFSLESTVLINPDNLINFPVKMLNIRQNGWEDELLILIKMININVAEHYYLLDEAVMSNLKKNINEEFLPYYSIFSAFNALCAGDYKSMRSNMNDALNKCTEKELFESLCLVQNSYKILVKKIDRNVIDSMNKGLLYEKAIQYTQAESEYHKAINASVHYALPNFYLGRLYSKQDNTPASDIYINRSLEVDPQLIDARLFKINNFIQKEDYSSAIQNVNIALQTNPIWQFYYLRALLLFELEQYEDAKTLILQTCIDINSHNIDEYLLLGDIYKALGDNVSSKIYYIEAGKIDSENEEYLQRIKNLH
jgi:hypothetical protein